jgi:hypothetical protein
MKPAVINTQICYTLGGFSLGRALHFTTNQSIICSEENRSIRLLYSIWYNMVFLR